MPLRTLKGFLKGDILSVEVEMLAVSTSLWDREMVSIFGIVFEALSELLCVNFISYLLSFWIEYE